MVSRTQAQTVDHNGNIQWSAVDSEPIGIVVPTNSSMRGLRDRTFIGLPIGSVIHQTTDGTKEPFMIIGKRNFSKTPRFIGVGLESFTIYNDICPRLGRSNRRGGLTNIKVATRLMSPYVGASIILPTDNMINMAAALYEGGAKSTNHNDFKSAPISVIS